MKLISKIMNPDSDGTLHLPLPMAWRGHPIRVKAELEPVADREEVFNADSRKHLKGFGCLSGKILMSPDFDEPLDAFKEYMA